MINFHVVTIFKESIERYTNTSILLRAKKKKLISVDFWNPRDRAEDKHKTADDKPFGGGPGMVMKAEPIVRTVLDILNVRNVLVEKPIKTSKTIRTYTTPRTKVALMSPSGKQFTQAMARNWAKRYDCVVIVAGHYEGIDARVKKILKAEEISIGPYILTGGELPAGIIIDAVARHIPGVLGKAESLEDERGVGIPVYTRPEAIKHSGKNYKVPKVLMSGHHKNIENWRKKHAR